MKTPIRGCDDAEMGIIARYYDTNEALTIEVRDGRIAQISQAKTQTDESLPIIIPGFVDLQINGFGGTEFSSLQVTPQRVAEITQRMRADGVTRYCPTVTTASFEILAHGMRTIAAACEQSETVRKAVVGIHLEGPYISPVDGPRGAHPLEYCRPPDWNEFQRLQDAAAGRIRIVTLGVEWDDAPRFIERLVAGGVIVSIGHTAAEGPKIQAAVDAGARLSTH